MPCGMAGAVPLSFTHQGIIREDGELVNGSRTMVATLYDNDTNEVIASKHETLSVVEGYYRINIEDIDEVKLREAQNVVLGLRLDNEKEMIPRLNVRSVPYAIVSKYAETAGNLECEGCISREHLDFNTEDLVASIKYARSDEVGGEALSAKKLSCSNCVSSEQANFKYAGSNEKGGAAISVADGVVNTKALANYAVTSDKLGSGAVTGTKILAGAVGTTALAGSAVTSAKIGAGAVTTEKLYSSSVTSPKIASGAVTSEKLGSDAAIVNMKASGYYAPRAWGTFQHLSAGVAAASNNNNANYSYGEGLSISLTNSNRSLAVTFKNEMPDTLYGVNISVLPTYNVKEDEYFRLPVPRIVSKTKKGFRIDFFKCVSEVSGTDEAYCAPSDFWYTWNAEGLGSEVTFSVYR